MEDSTYDKKTLNGVNIKTKNLWAIAKKNTGIKKNRSGKTHTLNMSGSLTAWQSIT